MDAVSKSAEEIARLLALANQALRKNRLTTPKGNSAYDYYQRLLTLDIDNEPASEIPDRIAERYAALAQSALQRDDFLNAALFVERGFQVQPNSVELLTVSSAVSRAISGVTD
jgi:hypothetical protein